MNSTREIMLEWRSYQEDLVIQSIIERAQFLENELLIEGKISDFMTKAWLSIKEKSEDILSSFVSKSINQLRIFFDKIRKKFPNQISDQTASKFDRFMWLISTNEKYIKISSFYLTAFLRILVKLGVNITGSIPPDVGYAIDQALDMFDQFQESHDTSDLKAQLLLGKVRPPQQ
jgi:hypothetical protein